MSCRKLCFPLLFLADTRAVVGNEGICFLYHLACLPVVEGALMNYHSFAAGHCFFWPSWKLVAAFNLSILCLVGGYFLSMIAMCMSLLED